MKIKLHVATWVNITHNQRFLICKNFQRCSYGKKLQLRPKTYQQNTKLITIPVASISQPSNAMFMIKRSETSSDRKGRIQEAPRKRFELQSASTV